MDNPIRDWATDPQSAAEGFVASPHVVGAAVAGVCDGRVVGIGTAGPADHETGAPLTVEHVLRPGSVTKMLTATLVMQCVDDGLVALDAPVTRYVPGFRLRDEGAAERVLVRHLLSHTSGIDANDRFVDHGSGDDATAAYVAALSDVGLLTTPGEIFSYNNAGTILAGHLVACVRGTTWEEALRHHVLEPAGMVDTSFVSGRLEGDPAFVARLARGHVAGPLGVTALPPEADEPTWTRALAPAGATLVSTPGDLARFVLGHLGTGDVPWLVRPETAVMMRERVVDAPGGVHQMAGSALGWQTWQSGDLSYVRHSGAHAGGSTVMAVDPAAGVAAVGMFNSSTGHAAMAQVLDTVPVPWPAEPAPADLSPYVGRYASGTIGTVVMTIGDGGSLMVSLPGFVDPAPIWPVDRGSFVGAGGQCAFFGFDAAGVPEYLRFQMRVLRRVAD